MVTDKDREAAEDWGTAIACKAASLAQAFAAHREAAIAERDAQLVNWLHSQKTCGCKGEHGWCNADSQLQLIADAIESGEPF